MAFKKKPGAARTAHRARKTSRISPGVLRLLQDIILLQENEDLPNRYDVEMRAVDRLKAYNRIECHITLYPYSRKISSDDIHFYPFEEYVNDVLSNQRSAYAKIQSPLDQIFGLVLGSLIALIFAHGQPGSMSDIEAIVSVFGAYIVGKELWNDIERMLINVSKNWRLRYQEGYYRYRLEKSTTLTHYSYLAKRQRYGKAMLLPAKIDFIKQSNSQTLRMCFDGALGTPAQDQSSQDTAHIHSIHVDPDLMGDLQKDGFMFGVKLSLDRRFLGMVRSLEVFQSLNGTSIGCLDDRGTWIEGALFYRKTLSLGRLKLYWSHGLEPGASILSVPKSLRTGRPRD